MAAPVDRPLQTIYGSPPVNLEAELIAYVKSEDPTLEQVPLSAVKANAIVMAWLHPQPLVDTIARDWVEQKLNAIGAYENSPNWQAKVTQILAPLIAIESEPPEGQMHTLAFKLSQAFTAVLAEEEICDTLTNRAMGHIKEKLSLPPKSKWLEKIRPVAKTALKEKLADWFSLHPIAYGELITQILLKSFPHRISI